MFLIDSDLAMVENGVGVDWGGRGGGGGLEPPCHRLVLE